MVKVDERARRYQRWRLWVAAVGLLLTGAYLVALVMTGAAVAVRGRLAAFTPHWWLQLPLAVIILGAGHRLLTLPLTWLGGFWLPRRFGLLHQPFRAWLWDGAKAILIGGLLGLLGTEVVYALLRATSWW